MAGACRDPHRGVAREVPALRCPDLHWLCRRRSGLGLIRRQGWNSDGLHGNGSGGTEPSVRCARPESIGAPDDAHSPGCAPLLQLVGAAFDVGEYDGGKHGLVLADRHRCPFDHRRDNAVRITFVRQSRKLGGSTLLTSLWFAPMKAAVPQLRDDRVRLPKGR